MERSWNASLDLGEMKQEPVQQLDDLKLKEFDCFKSLSC